MILLSTNEALKVAPLLKPGRPMMALIGAVTIEGLERNRELKKMPPLNFIQKNIFSLFLWWTHGADMKKIEAACVREDSSKPPAKYKFYLLAENGEDMQFLMDNIEKGTIKPVTDKVYPLEEAVEASEYAFGGRAKGKVIVKFGSSVA